MVAASKSAKSAHSEQPAAELRRSPRKTTAPSSSNESAAASHVDATANAATASCSFEHLSDVLEALQCAFDGLQVVSKALRNGVCCMVAGGSRRPVSASALARRAAAAYADASQRVEEARTHVR